MGLLTFKLNWLVLVLGQERWLALACVLLCLQLCLGLAARGMRAVRQLVATFTFAACGIAVDNLLQLGGVLRFPDAHLPAWLCVLWVAFAAVLAQFQALLRRARLAALVLAGALAGVVGYAAGAALGAVEFGIAPWLALLLIALPWCAALPLARWMFAPETRLVAGAPFVAVLMPLLFVGAPAPAHGAEAWTLLGEGRHSIFMLALYTARLEVAAEPFEFPGEVPFRLTLRYHRAAAPERVLDATLGEWQRQGIEPPAAWVDMLRAALPPIARDDELSLQVASDYSARLLHNGQAVATFDDAAFTRAFAGIWLGANTSAPQLRRKLLGDES